MNSSQIKVVSLPMCFHYQVPYFDNGLRFKFWRIELAATDNGNGTFDVWALGRQAAGGPPNFVRGKHALLLDDVTEEVAHDFHQYELHYDESLGTASLFFDSGTGLAATTVSGFVGDASGIPHDIDAMSDNVVAFGTFTDAGAGHLKVRSVLFNVGEEFPRGTTTTVAVSTRTTMRSGDPRSATLSVPSAPAPTVTATVLSMLPTT